MWRNFYKLVSYRFFTKPQISTKTWNEWAGELPRSAFIMYLANQVANDIGQSHHTIAELNDAIDDCCGGSLQHSAELFIENYYFGFPSFDPHKDKLIGAFRRLVKRKLAKNKC